MRLSSVKMLLLLKDKSIGFLVNYNIIENESFTTDEVITKMKFICYKKVLTIC